MILGSIFESWQLNTGTGKSRFKKPHFFSLKSRYVWLRNSNALNLKTDQPKTMSYCRWISNLGFFLKSRVHRIYVCIVGLWTFFCLFGCTCAQKRQWSMSLAFLVGIFDWQFKFILIVFAILKRLAAKISVTVFSKAQKGILANQLLYDLSR